MRVILLVSLIALFPSSTSADQGRMVPLPGHSQTITDAVSSATDIAIVKFTDIGQADAAAMNRVHYGHAKIRILENLRGENIKKIERGDSLIGYTLFWSEFPPDVGTAYFLTLGAGRLKIFPATKDNIARVKTLMASTY